MSIYSRMDIALMHVQAAKKALERASEHPDPVWQRRLMVEAAKHYRKAADELDDGGRIE